MRIRRISRVIFQASLGSFPFSPERRAASRSPLLSSLQRGSRHKIGRSGSMACDELVNLLDDIVAAIGLRYEAPIIGQRLRSRTMIGRGNQERYVRPALLNAFGKS